MCIIHHTIKKPPTIATVLGARLNKYPIPILADTTTTTNRKKQKV